MGMNGLFRAGISVLIAIVAELIIEATVPIDTINVYFNNLLGLIKLSAGWHSVALGTLNGWTWYDRSFVIVTIALLVWMASFAFSTADYGRQMPRV